MDRKRIMCFTIGVAVFALIITKCVLTLMLQPQKISMKEVNSWKVGKDIVSFNIDNVESEYVINTHAGEGNIGKPKGHMSYFFQEGNIQTMWKSYSNIGDNIKISGYAFIPKQDVRIPDVYLVLLDTNTDKYYKMHTEVERREDVTEKFAGDGCNYDLSGLKGNIAEKYLDSAHIYQIGLIYKTQQENFLILSDYRINGGVDERKDI